eukprot:9467407-Alexandrium_andersonii.AAC.1
MALHQLWNVMCTRNPRKAHGPDRIPASVWKQRAEFLAPLVHPLFVKVGLYGREPVRWSGAAIVP